MEEKKTTLLEEYKRLATLFSEAASHLDYCGYGDRWERECAKDLPERIEAELKRIEEILKASEDTPAK